MVHPTGAHRVLVDVVDALHDEMRLHLKRVVVVRPHLVVLVARRRCSVGYEALQHPLAAAFVLVVDGFYDRLAGEPFEVADNV